MSKKKCKGKQGAIFFPDVLSQLMAWNLAQSQDGLMQDIWQEFQYSYLHNRMTQKSSTKGAQLNNWQHICKKEMLMGIRNKDWAEIYKKINLS